MRLCREFQGLKSLIVNIEALMSRNDRIESTELSYNLKIYGIGYTSLDHKYDHTVGQYDHLLGNFDIPQIIPIEAMHLH